VRPPTQPLPPARNRPAPLGTGVGFPRRFGAGYTLLKQVGAGGMGAVYMALSGTGEARRLCALKVMQPPPGETEDADARFADESRITTQLSSENLVYVFDAGVERGSRYLAMEFIEGRSLADIFERAEQAGRKMPVAIAQYITTEVLAALSYIHRFRQLHLVHRDLSPANVMLTFTGSVKLIDFGVAQWVGRGAQTVVGGNWGRMGYKAPEQHVGDPVDQRADIFSAGVLFWELLTGQRLFPETENRPLRPDIAPPSSLNPHVVPALDAVVARATALDRDARYGSAEEFHAAVVRHVPPGDRRADLTDYLGSLFGQDIQADKREQENLVALATQPQKPQPLQNEAGRHSPRPHTPGPRTFNTRASGSPDFDAPHPDFPDPDLKAPGPRTPGPGYPVDKAPGQNRSDDLVGAVLSDRYDVHRVLGQGAMGTVYEARHRGIGKRVAIKVANALGGGTELIERLKVEAAAAGQIDHPNVAMVTDSGATAAGAFYYVMEYVEGIDLGAVIARDAPLSAQRALTVAVQICRAVEAAHAQGVIHRDLKPANIMLVRDQDGGDHVKVLDFGLAKLLQPSNIPVSDLGAQLTRPDKAMGTPRYMAPEQILANAFVGEAADQYAVCVVLYEMLTGRTPHSALAPGLVDDGREDALALCRRKLDQPPVVIANHRSDLSPELEAAIMRGLGREAAGRFPAVSDLRHALTESLRALRAAPERSGLGHPQRTASRTFVVADRPKRKYWGLAAVAALAGIGLAWLVVSRPHADPNSKPMQASQKVEGPLAPVPERLAQDSPQAAVQTGDRLVSAGSDTQVPLSPKAPSATRAPRVSSPSDGSRPERSANRGGVSTGGREGTAVSNKKTAASRPRLAPPRQQRQERQQPQDAEAMQRLRQERSAQAAHASLGRAELAYQRGDLLVAEREARKALALGAGVRGHLILAKILSAMERTEEARAQYERALAMDPDNTAARQALFGAP